MGTEESKEVSSTSKESADTKEENEKKSRKKFFIAFGSAAVLLVAVCLFVVFTVLHGEPENKDATVPLTDGSTAVTSDQDGAIDGEITGEGDGVSPNTGGTGGAGSATTDGGTGGGGGNGAGGSSGGRVWVDTSHWERVMVAPAWDEPVWESHTFCRGCGADLNELGVSVEAHMEWHLEVHGTAYGWYNTSVIVDYIHHEAVYEDQWVSSGYWEYE